MHYSPPQRQLQDYADVPTLWTPGLMIAAAAIILIFVLRRA